MEQKWEIIEPRYRAYLLTRKRSISTTKSYIYNVRLFARWCVDHGIVTTQAATEEVELYLLGLAEKLSTNTIPLRLACLRAFFGYCVSRNFCESNPTEGLSVMRDVLLPRRPFTITEINKLIAACTSERDQAMIRLTYSAGLRISELIGLHSDDVDLKEGLIRVRGKGGKERLLSPGLTALRCLLPFLHGKDGVLWWAATANPLTVERAKVNMARLGHRAHVEHAHWHRLRVTFANEALAAGVALEDLQVLMGHAHISTTIHYAGYTINSRALDQMRRLNLGDRLVG